MQPVKEIPIAAIEIDEFGDEVLVEATWRECGCSELRVNPFHMEIMECESTAGPDCGCDCHAIEAAEYNLI